MKLHSDTSGDELRITGYGPGFVRVGERHVRRSFVISSQGIRLLEQIDVVDDVQWRALECLHESPPEVLLVGTGPHQRFPSPQLFRELAALRIGVEAMSSPAACRTFNILLSEGRNVAAVILIE